MNNRHIKKIITILSCAVLAALFIVTLFFASPKISAVPETTGIISESNSIKQPDGTWQLVKSDFEFGKDVAAVRINDLADLGKITKVNYIADKYVRPGHLAEDMQIVDLTKPFEFAEKGTLIFVIANLDSWADDFDEQTERLAKYKIGDYWRFTVQLPEIFSASNVYQKANLVARNGEIENYDFADYNTNYDIKTEKFSQKTDSTYINLQFYTRREALANSFSAAQIITIHYQSTGSSLSGIADCPLIGTESAVKGLNQDSNNLLVGFAILAAVVFAVLAVLAFVERSLKFVSAIVWVFGITVMLLSRFFLCGAATVPLLWSALSLAMSFIILGGALLATGRNFGKVPLKYIFPALSAVGAILVFLYPFIPFGAATAMFMVCKIIKGVCVTALTAFIGFALASKKDEHGILQLSCTAVIAVAVIASLFLPQIFPAQLNPMFWLCAVVATATFVNVIIAITDMKKSNLYLTENLHKEVERQVKDIKSVIDERDDLIRFISHDMKKPLLSSVSLLNTAIEREKDGEQIKTLQIVKQNDQRVVANLSEISSYEKFNYLSEPSQVINLSELCAILYKYHQLDCNANGIILKNTVDAPVKAFAKPKGIENVVSNIIINAIAHADCKTVTLSIKTDKNKVVLRIADDGKGIDGSLDVFKPYVSENEGESSGLGLYICKNIINSMNGELSFDTSDSGTTFYISLLKA